MSKSTKAKPRKSSAPKSAPAPAPKSAAPPVVTAPPMLEREDQLILQLALSEMKNKELQINMVTQEYNKAKENWGKQINAVNEKYGLDATKDKIDLSTGLIEKG